MEKAMGVAVVTGAGRGIGLALVRRLKERGETVVAACRRRSPALESLGVRIEAGLDLTATDACGALARRLAGAEIGLLIHNAGQLIEDTFETVRIEDLRTLVEINAFAPLVLTQALVAHMKRGSKVALITSRMGSMGDNTSGGYYAYRMSKAALNAAGVSMAHDLAPRGIAVAVLHPGAVRTEMTGGRGHIDPEHSAAGLLARIDELDLANTGRFLHQNGDALPW
jgi:NAD(P)-dependent dehydrogenase (short-subunit alcohol dehydrogenase family)